MNKFKIEGFSRITKRAAEKLYEQGKTVYVSSCNMSPVSIWQPAIPINRQDEMGESSFPARINAFEYYNCDRERGRYAAFYFK